MADVKVKKKMRRICGLRDFYVAQIIENTKESYKTGDPIKVGRAVSAKITDKYDTSKEYSDDGTEDIDESYTETDVEIGVNTLSNSEYALLFDTLHENGFLVKSSDDKAKEVAIGFRAKRTDGTYDFTWLYVGKFERPDENFETQADKVKTQSATLKGTFYQREKIDIVKDKDNKDKEKQFYEIRVNESELVDENTDARTVIKDWFSKVQEYTVKTEAAA